MVAAVPIPGLALFQRLITVDFMPSDSTLSSPTRSLGALNVWGLFWLLVATVAAGLDSNPLFAGWYTFATSVSGVRGAVGFTLAALLSACLWALAALVVFRARKGLVVAGTPANERRRRRRRPAVSGATDARW